MLVFDPVPQIVALFFLPDDTFVWFCAKARTRRPPDDLITTRPCKIQFF
jgi:hypothetical protein